MSLDRQFCEFRVRDLSADHHLAFTDEFGNGVRWSSLDGILRVSLVRGRAREEVIRRVLELCGNCVVEVVEQSKVSFAA